MSTHQEQLTELPFKTVENLSSSSLDDAPSVVESDVSSQASSSSHRRTIATATTDVPKFVRTTPKRIPLQWQFKGLTIWLEFEEFDNDLTKANYHFASMYGTEVIPTVHATAIYGMKHLSQEEACERLRQVVDRLPNGQWPVMEAPVAVKQDIAQEGRPGQVCSVAWAELTLKTSDEHEQALDALYDLFDVERTKNHHAWTPHLSLAYDNPEDSVLQLSDIISYVFQHPTLLRNSRRVKAVSLWDTQGKMGEWTCLDRVYLY